MSTDAPPVLEVRGLGKRLTSDLVEARRQGIRDIWDEVLVRSPDEERALRTSEFWALRNIDVTVAPGEALGVIGFNGAGKSTFLRLLHGLTRPDEGSIRIRGAHTAMLSLAAPFSRILSGRENITAAAAVHGIPRRALPALTEAVQDFSELDPDVLDAPMTTYSTGMQLRLGYAIAAQLPTDLLLVDEVIAVGDLAFQRKCLSHIRGHLHQGGAVVLVSHDLWMIQALCSRAIVLDKGEIEAEGDTNHAMSAYLRKARPMNLHVPRQRQARTAEQERSDSASIEVVSCRGATEELPRNGEDLDIEMVASSSGGAVTATWRLDILTANRQVCLASIQPEHVDGRVALDVEPTTIRWRITGLPLLPGTFHLSPHLHHPDTGEELGSATTPLPFEVHSRHTRLDTLAQLPGAGALSSVTSRYEMLDPDRRPGGLPGLDGA